MRHQWWARNASGAILVLCGLFSLSGTTVEPDLRKVDPRLLHSGGMAIGAAREMRSGAAKAETLGVPVFLRAGSDDPTLPDKVRNLGGTAHRISPRIYTARLPMDGLRYASNWPSVSYIEAGRRVRPLLDLSRPAVFAHDVQAGTGLPGGVGYTGLGVLVGIIDTGMDGSHPDFSTGSPLSSRVVHTFLFQGGGSALVDTNGHGTHVTGIAAGNGRASNGAYTGMAKDAEIMVGRAGISDFFDTDLVTGVADLFAFAGSVVKPAAVNLSLGVMTGPHDGTSSFEASINDLATGAAGSRRLVAVASGNEQDKGEHFRATLPAFGSSTASLSILPNASAGDAVVDLWADGEDRFTVTATRGGGSASESVTAASGTTASNASGTIFIANRTDDPPNHATHLLVIFSPPSPSAIPAFVRLDRVRNGGSGKVDGYIDASSGNFAGGGVSSTGTTIEPANGDNVIAVGSFRTKTIGGGPDTLGISAFSSTGPTRDGRVKPDVAAPGEVIYSARSSQASFFSFEIAPNDNYAILRGTSMAAPHGAGIAALVWESNLDLTGAQMRERLRRTADPVGASPDTTWGFGRMNALRGVRETVASISGPARATPGSPVSLTSGNSSGGFGAAISSYLWSAPGASLASPNQSGTTFTATTPGIYTVSLTATAGGSPGSDSRNILVNAIPTATFTVPASDNAGRPVTFRGIASDADSQPLTRHWLLLSRPAGSAASITTASVDNAVFTPDVAGTYEIGLRADDGLDNSALVVGSYTTLGSSSAPASSDGGGGGGGCLSIARLPVETIDASSVVSLCFLLLPAAVSGWRRFVRSGATGGSR